MCGRYEELILPPNGLNDLRDTTRFRATSPERTIQTGKCHIIVRNPGKMNQVIECSCPAAALMRVILHPSRGIPVRDPRDLCELAAYIFIGEVSWAQTKGASWKRDL